MYSVYIEDIMLPVTPEKITWNYKGQNDTVNLINMEEMNRIRIPGLMEFSMETVLPGTKVPYARYENGFKEPYYYINIFENIMKECKAVAFSIKREKLPYGRKSISTKRMVTIEDMSVKESYDNGLDMVVSIRLKEFKAYQSTNISNFEEVTVRKSDKVIKSSYTVKSGDSLWSICKRELNDGSRYMEIAKLNSITNPSLIYPGQVIRFE